MISDELNLSAQVKDVLARGHDRLLADTQRSDVPMYTTVYDAGDDPRCTLILLTSVRVKRISGLVMCRDATTASLVDDSRQSSHTAS